MDTENELIALEVVRGPYYQYRHGTGANNKNYTFVLKLCYDIPDY